MQVTLEHQNGEIVCTYEAKESTSWLVCELVQEEIEKIKTLSHKAINPYLKGLYQRELRKLTPNIK